MLQMSGGGITLQEGTNIVKELRRPVVRLGTNFVIDDSVLEKPTLLTGQVSCGKSTLICKTIMPQVFNGMEEKDSAVIFAAKSEMIDGFYDPSSGDILLDYNSIKPENIWNIFLEMDASADPEKTLIELADVMFSRHKNKVQPFFTSAPKDMFKSLTMYLYKYYEKKTGKKPNNSVLIGFFDSLTLKDSEIDGKKKKGLLTLIKEVQELHHLADYLGDGGSQQALGVLGELRVVLRETFQGGAFVRAGEFSVRRALQEGRKIFLRYNFSENTESSIVFFNMLIDQMIKISLAENGQKVWFILDEFSLLIGQGNLRYLEAAMAYGRGNGFRLIAAIQSVQLMEKNRTESEANCILGLFPNIFCFFTSDYKTRQLLAHRYGSNFVSVIGFGGGKPELREQNIIQDEDFYKIAMPGDCIVSLAGYSPFFFRNHHKN